MSQDPTSIPNTSSPATQQPQVPSVTTSPTSHANDLKYMTSNQDLLLPSPPAKDISPRRPSKLLTSTPKLGNRSPSSIPSSPSSIHSSSSAIFERDIEPIPNSFFGTQMLGETSAVTTSNHHHPHSQTLVLESAVPAVLSSAATALADTDPTNKDSPMNISVIVPAASSPQQTVGTIPNTQTTRSMSIPVSSANSNYGGSVVGSRSSSPTRRSFSVVATISNGSPEHRPSIFERTSAQAQPPAAFPGSRSPATSNSPSPPSMSPLSSTIPLPGPAMDSHAPSSTTAQQNKRLSFISYNDLLTCAPVSSTLLSTLTSPPTDATPPHIPAVQGTAVGMNAATESMGEEGGEWIGGEWEREGFGRGLEERLEQFIKESRPSSMHLTA